MLKADSVVYRVVEVDPADEDEPHTWKVAAITVQAASARQIRLKTYFSGIARRVFHPDALGRTFFETPLQAVQHFLASQQLEIESLDRKKRTVERAIAWARGQEGM